MDIRIIARSPAGQDRQEAVVGLDQPVVMGRDPHCPLTLFGEGLSRRHFLLELRGGELVIVDQSVNGTKVNGKWVPRGEPFPVAPGDMIEIPNYQISFEKVGASSASSTVIPAEPSAGPLMEAQPPTPPAVEPVELLPGTPLPRPSAGNLLSQFLSSFTGLEYLAVVLALVAVLFLLVYIGM